MMMRRSVMLACYVGVGAVATALTASSALAEHWPQWRGPEHNGSSSTADPPVQWSEDSNIRWKVELPGRGSSTPIIWGDRLFLLSARATDRPADPVAEADGPNAAANPPGDRPGSAAAPERRGPRAGGSGRGGRGGGGGSTPTHYHQFLVTAYDRHSGEPLWQRVATEQVPHEAGHGTNTFASSSPITDGQHLWVNFGSRGVYCFDLDGNPIWQRDLGKMQTRSQFGEASSPALQGGKLIIPWDHEGQSQLFALDAKTGETLWQVERDEPTTWATPLITPWQGSWQVVTNGKRVRSYELETGALLWEAGGQVDNPIPTPVRYQDFVIAMTGYRGNAIHAIKLDAQGDVTGTDAVLWSRDDAAPYVASPVLYKGQLYFTKSREGILSSVDAATGAVVIPPSRLPQISSIYASPVAAQDRIYITGREGATVVLRHGPEFEVLAVNQLDDVLDASPVMIGELMYLRGERFLYCVGPPPAE